MRTTAWFAAVSFLFAACVAEPASSQSAAPPAAAVQATTPATKLEAFKPKAGSIVILGYDELGTLGTVSVDVREIRQVNGPAVRGMLVEVSQGQYRSERAFIDSDEIPELLKGIDAIVAVSANPTKFKNFEVRYETRGNLEVTAFNDSKGKVSYVVKAGSLTKASAFNLDASDLKKLRDMIVQAQAKLAEAGG